MSFAEYSQLAEDHTNLLILVKQVGSHLTPKHFSKVFDRIARLNTLKVVSPPRIISLRYKRNYTIENNAWGNFQAHRKVLGLISIGKCENENDATELSHLHEDLKEQYEGTLLDSRLILFGSCFDQANQEEESETVVNEYSDDNLNICHEDVNFQIGPTSSFKESANVNGSCRIRSNDNIDDDDDNQGKSVTAEMNSDPLLNSNERKGRELNSSQVLHFCSEDESPNLEEHLQEFLSSLFWVLESKRLDRSNERLDHLTLITAPFERKDSSSSDIDSRLYRKRCQGRLKKHLGDLCLLSGVCGEAVLHYRTSLDILRAANDYLWVAGAYEGLAVALYMDLHGRSVNSQSLTRFPSFSLKPGLSRLKEAKLRPSIKNMTSTVRNGLDLADNSGPSLSPTLPDDVRDNYKEAVINYSKFPEAGIVEMEASLKACRILLAHQRTLDAADFLQNIVTINVELMEEEKIQRFMTLSLLYSAINMPRKASFYRRVAAMHCVAPSNPKPAWSQCYHLLIKSLPGYKLSLDPKEISQDGPSGWSSVQLRVVHELVYTARRMGNASIAIRHLSFLLHTMFDYLRNDECSELANVLKSYTNKCSGTHLSIALDDGTILPPVAFFRFPTVRSLRLVKLLPHCRPTHFKNDRQMESPKPSINSPFIYSPLTLFNSKTDKSSNPEQFYWIEEESSEVEIQLYNPLPFELAIDGFGLITEGVEVICHPTDIVLPAESGSVQVKLSLIPHRPGKLTILGYTTQVMGVKSQCRLREISHLSQGDYSTLVVPALPKLKVTTSLPKMESFSTMAGSDCVVASGSLTVYAGQSSTFEMKLLNTGKMPVERVDIFVNSTVQQDILKKLVIWDESSFRNQLPLQPECHSSLNFTVHGLSNFLSPELCCFNPAGMLVDEEPLFQNSLWSLMDSRDSTGTVTVELLVLIQYSGGGGGGSNISQFCRQCSVSLTLDIQPSIYITSWQILPSLRYDCCSLELDVENCSPVDITLSPGQVSVASRQKHRLCLDLPQIELTVPYSSSSFSSASSSFNTSSSSSFLSLSVFNNVSDASSLVIRDAEAEILVRHHVCHNINIGWTMPSSGASGQVYLGGLYWTKSQCALLQILPITWEIVIDDERLLPGAVVSRQCLSSFPTSFTIFNRSASELHDVVLRFHPCQDFSQQELSNDEELNCHKQYAIPIGCTETHLAKVSPGANAIHSCSFFFPWCGAYQLFCICEATLTESNLFLKAGRQIWKQGVKLEMYNASVTAV